MNLDLMFVGDHLPLERMLEDGIEVLTDSEWMKNIRKSHEVTRPSPSTYTKMISTAFTFSPSQATPSHTMHLPLILIEGSKRT